MRHEPALSLINVTGVTPWANIAVITLVSILPPVVAGLALQRYITRGLTFGAVK